MVLSSPFLTGLGSMLYLRESVHGVFEYAANVLRHLQERAHIFEGAVDTARQLFIWSGRWVLELNDMDQNEIRDFLRAKRGIVLVQEREESAHKKRLGDLAGVQHPLTKLANKRTSAYYGMEEWLDELATSEGIIL